MKKMMMTLVRLLSLLLLLAVVAPLEAQTASSGLFRVALAPSRPVTAVELTALDERLHPVMGLPLHQRLSSLREVLAAEPASPWAASLWLNVGLLEYEGGYYSRSIEAFGKSWALSKDSQDPALRSIADRAGTERARMLSRLGRIDELKAQMQGLETRPMRGLTARYREDAHQGLYAMDKLPGQSFRCGPFALQNLFRFRNDKRAMDPKILNAQSTNEGYSLKQVLDLADSLGERMQVIKRAPASAVPVPSIVHWKAGHYAALVEMEDGLYHLVDPTFVEEHWVRLEALEDESSGYFIAAKGPLASGWTLATAEERVSVHGKGYVTGDKKFRNPCSRTKAGLSCPNACAPGLGKSSAGGRSCPGMPVADLDLNLAALEITDIPLSYQPARGPAVEFVLSYHQRTEESTMNGPATSSGANWSFGWGGYYSRMDQYNCEGFAGTLEDKLFERGGGESDGQPGVVEEDHSGHPGRYTRRLNSGWVEEYDLGPYRHVDVEAECSAYGTESPPVLHHYNVPALYVTRRYLTKLSDPQGNALTFGYDEEERLVTVTDAIGQVTHLYYTNANERILTQVADPFGRHADLSYDSSGRLTGIQDSEGLSSSFTYDSVVTDRIASMTTPYGTTDMAYTEGYLIDRSLTLTDPEGRQRKALRQSNNDAVTWDNSVTPDTSKIDIYPSASNYRNVFYWDEKGMADAPNDLSKAFVYHFLHTPDGLRLGSTLESVRPPLKNRIYFNYVGAVSVIYEGVTMTPLPSKVATVLDDNSTQLDQYAYNSQLNMTQHIDPAGRELDYEYASNGRDVVKIKNGHDDVLARFEYDGPASRPTKVYDASGNATTLAYNSYGQLTGVQLPTGESTTLSYDSGGFLTDIYPPAPGTHVHFTPDEMQRIATSEDAVNGELSYEYDDLNRLTSVSYPDGTSEEIAYDKLDVDHTVDRNERTTTYTYDAVRRLKTVLDPKSQLTQLDWCNCGALSSLTDPSGHVTSWAYGIDGRLLKKIYNDSSEVNYAYEARSGRLHSITDALQQVTQFTYDISNLMTKTEYLNAKIATPQVQFEYDSVFGRLTKMTDGTGVTNFGYNSIPSEGSQSNGGGRLHSVDGPLSNDTIVYGYDAAGRAISTAVNGVAETLAYNANGQLATVTNPLGTFTYGYEAGTGRLSDVVYPAGKTHLDYWATGATAESGRLLDIKHYNPALALLSQYGYDYDAAGQITKWQQKQGSQPQTEYALGYDLAGQLQGSTLTATDTETVLKHAFWKYDASGNRTGQTVDAVTTTYTANTLNQMTEVKDGNPLVFKGKVNKPSVVQVQGVSVTADSHNLFSVPLALTFGAHTVTITAQSGAESVTQTYGVFSGQELLYDLNGNMTSDGKQKYEWDAENRLVKISTLNPSAANPAKSSEFVYDGFSRRTRIVEKQGVQVVADRRFIWDFNWIAEERDASNAVVKRFYDDGVQVVAGSQAGTYYYLTDHLGSIRGVLNGQGLTVASYDYGLWGKRTRLSGTFDADFGFVGQLVHEPSGLNFTKYRAYSPSLARWLSRDPLEEADSSNLYGYVGNSPVTSYDPLGLATYCQNRMLAGPAKLFGVKNTAMYRWQPGSHTFVFTTNPNGTLANTYSWGNTADLRGWSMNQPEDIEAALDAMRNNIGLDKIGGDDLDPFVARALDMLMSSCDRHKNGIVARNCKFEASQILDLAKRLRDEANKPISTQGSNAGCGN